MKLPVLLIIAVIAGPRIASSDEAALDQDAKKQAKERRQDLRQKRNEAARAEADKAEAERLEARARRIELRKKRAEKRKAENLRGYSSPASILQCPKMGCPNPCVDGSGAPLCDAGTKCRTAPATFEWKGLECVGCPMFDSCVSEEMKIGAPTTPCPQHRCPDSCMDYTGEEPAPKCALDEECVTRQVFFTFEGRNCPTCDAFDRCEKIDSSNGPPVCPMVICRVDVCADKCGEYENCITTNSYTEAGCPVCPAFDRCEERQLTEEEECLRMQKQMGCTDPCLDWNAATDPATGRPPPRCSQTERCLLQPTFLQSGCQACPVFERCEELDILDPLPLPGECPIPENCPDDPCEDDPCPYNTRCLTKPSYFEHEGLSCRGCSVKDRCETTATNTTSSSLCPMQDNCLNPCYDYSLGFDDAPPICGEGYECRTTMPFSDNGCEGCPQFDGCDII